MTADSRYTKADGTSRDGEKLFRVPYLNAGLSYWGRGLPGHPDEWINQFIQENSGSPNLADFAYRLQEALRGVRPPLVPADDGQGTIGLHLAGYTKPDAPTVFHIHNGISQSLALRGRWVDPNLVNANDDFSPEIGQIVVSKLGGLLALRNGDYRPYVAIWDQGARNWAEYFASEIRKNARVELDLSGRAIFVASQIEMMRVLYVGWKQQLLVGSELPTVGGPIKYLTIQSPGVLSEIQVAEFK